MSASSKNSGDFGSLVAAVAALRGVNGCPWNLKQTHDSLGRFAIEEAFELAEAIDTGETTEIRDELGDLLLQVVLNAEIARQNGTFTLEDVIRAITEKVIRRNPHVFKDVKITDAEEVLRNAHAIKSREPKAAGQVSSPHEFNVPVHLPALLRAHKIGERTKSRGFDWATADECWQKVSEELAELEEARREHHGLAREEAELGDVLFSLAQWARHRGLDAERALRRTNQSFATRYRRMREIVEREDGLPFEQLPPELKERRWKQAKRQ